MKQKWFETFKYLTFVLVVGGLLISIIYISRSNSKEDPALHEPAQIETIQGSQVKRLTLAPKAVERLGIQTVAVREDAAGKSIPLSAVIYSHDGSAWTYTSPSDFVYIRQPIAIARIDGENTLLSTGPPAGTKVVTVGASELYGIETEVGH